MHKKGMLHLDIKPKNLFCDFPDDGNLSSDFRVKLCDFGLVRRFENDFVILTVPGARGFRVVGTPCYSAPEVLNQGIYSPQADILATDITLYYIQTGDYPFDSEKFNHCNQTETGIQEDKFNNCSTETRDATVAY